MAGGRNKLQQAIHNGHVLQQARVKPVRLVPNIKVQPHDGLVYLLLGEDVPELGTALNAEHARTLGEALLNYAAAIEATPAPDVPPDDQGPRLIIPGA